LHRLLEIGFEKVGHWRLSGGAIVCAVRSVDSSGDGLYAFACGDRVKYIGRTRLELSRRMAAYTAPGSGQAEELANNARIRSELERGGTVDILALPDHGLLHHGPFRLSLAGGLEDDLIRVLDPEWNPSRVATEVARAPHSGSGEKPAGPAGEMFELVLQPTFYHSGFFNVRAVHERFLGADGEVVALHVPGRAQPIRGQISRTADAERPPRIVGGSDLRDWFQAVATVGQVVGVKVQARNSIALYPLEARG
jgi:hypothetical protein